MAKKTIVAVNAGSSSVKVSAYRAERGQPPVQIAEAQVSGLTAPPTALKYVRSDDVVIEDREVGDQVDGPQDAFGLLLETFIDDQDLPEIKDRADIGIVCHRIVHGGDYARPQLVSDATYHHLEKLNDLAPLHNANSLGIVEMCIRDLPRASNVACFDSQFHATIPEHIRTYPIDQEVARNNHLRKYGFHGISYAFITRATAAFLGKNPPDVSIIALHLGSGASACAIRNGKSLDTSMGLTPLAGLPGATRSGSVDPSLVDPTMRLAFDLVVDRISGFVGAYFVTLRGRVDALVFAGGIGEKSDRLRAAVVDQVGCLGFAIDEAANGATMEGTVVDVGRKGVVPRVLVCHTDEQYEMARGCAEDERLW
ncbi:acetate kinase [Trichocladium antarcticum]|uniref:Probable acetate kinase n=1 Tax=Trichocladium antarcticum TaxID=1450529 RepID=A0AAN6ZBB2_9PEZI|nr:acetate kinase [Trichocladium antarcticum]